MFVQMIVGIGQIKALEKREGFSIYIGMLAQLERKSGIGFGIRRVSFALRPLSKRAPLSLSQQNQRRWEWIRGARRDREKPFEAVVVKLYHLNTAPRIHWLLLESLAGGEKIR